MKCGKKFMEKEDSRIPYTFLLKSKEINKKIKKFNTVLQ